MKMKPFRYLYSTPLLVVVWMCLMGSWASVARADLVKFFFEAELTNDLGPSFPFLLGQRVSGNYTFELNTPATTVPSPNTVTFYFDAITDFTVTLDGFGTGTGNEGDIFLGDPVQTTGSFNFLSDIYGVSAPVTGITVPSQFGDRNLFHAIIQLQDLDREGLDSENLLATPPNLALFLDNTGPTFDTDGATLGLNFYFSDGSDFPDGSSNTAVFQLTSLTAEVNQVPEPSSVLGLLALGSLGLGLPLRRKLR